MNINNIPNINYLWSGLIMDELYRNGVRHICISPGSRSTPLTLSAASHKGLKKTVHYDERGLAFYALGISAVKREPVAVISTSGTAVANFFPAVIESSKKKLPLIFLTADRPPELRKTGALQSIDQAGIFGKYVRWAIDLPAPDLKIRPEFVLTTIDQAIFMSKSPVPGPVQINCMFREPLAPEIREETAGEINIDKRWLESEAPYTTYFQKNEEKDLLNKDIVEIINRSKFGIIITGKLKNREEALQVVRLSEHLNWPLFGDIVSGTRNISGKNSVKNWDLLLRNNKLLRGKIDTVIHFGGRITSKKWYEFIEKERPENYMTVINHPLRNDPLHIVSHRLYSSPGNTAKNLICNTAKKASSRETDALLRLSDETEKIVEEFLNSTKEMDEIFIAREISKFLDPGETLFLGNSMPVRDMDMFYNGGIKDILWGGNRGASGIDGNIASAVGFAEGSGIPLTMIVGDISLFHDLNSLILVKKSSVPLNIVVINNNGGGIFSFLPVSELWEDNKNYFLTRHNMNFENAAKMFGINYVKISDKSEFLKKYTEVSRNGKNNLIEISVNMEKNIDAHKKLMKKLSDFYKISGGGKENE